MRLLLPLGALGALLANACTPFILDGLVDDQASCAVPGDCAAGFACQDGSCVAAEGATLPPPTGTVIGPSGGVVEGPDGVTLTIPAGALTADAELDIVQESATNVPRGCEERSGFYRVAPELDFATPALLAIPVEDCAACVVCAKPADDGAPWTALAAPSPAPADRASALVDRTGAVVVAGVSP